MGEILDKQIKENWFVERFDISQLINKSDLETRIATLAAKAELKAEQNKIVKL